MKLFIIPLLSFFLVSCSSESSNNESESIEEEISVDSSDNGMDEVDQKIYDDAHPTYTSEIFFKEGTGWGYRILMNSQPYINQPHIPAIPGNKGFSDNLKAQKTADFAIQKINNGIMPPTISEYELDSLGVLD